MSNYAALISPIVVSGSMTSAGTPNVNGKVWAYLPDTTTPVSIYADAAASVTVTQPITLDAGGRVPYAIYPHGVYAAQPIRLLVQDSSGNIVSDSTFESGAGSAGAKNPGFPSSTTQDQIDSAIAASVGGTDGNYLAYAGGTARSLQSAIRSAGITPEDFGAKGDGLTDDTNAIQAMINRLAANPGGMGRLMAPNYKISSALSFPAGFTGITLIGPGRGATVITQASSADIFSSTSGTGLVISGLSFSGNLGFTGVANLGISNVTISRGNSSSAYALSLAGCSVVALEDMAATGGSQCVSLSGACANVYFSRCALGAGLGVSTACIDIAGSTSSVYAYGTRFNAGSGGVTGVKWESGASGTGFYFTDCPTLGGVATPFDTTNIAASEPGILQKNCGFDNVTTNITSGSPTTFTPSSVPNEITANCNVNGAGGTVTVAAPVPALSGSTPVGRFFEYHFNNVNGNPVTWNLNAIFKVNASIDGTDTHRTAVGFWWDGTNLRERYRAQTA